MANKVDIPVVINGKVYTLSGYEGKIIFKMLQLISTARLQNARLPISIVG